jgi:hypothetical protein
MSRIYGTFARYSSELAVLTREIAVFSLAHFWRSFFCRFETIVGWHDRPLRITLQNKSILFSINNG